MKFWLGLDPPGFSEITYNRGPDGVFFKKNVEYLKRAWPLFPEILGCIVMPRALGWIARTMPFFRGGKLTRVKVKGLANFGIRMEILQIKTDNCLPPAWNRAGFFSFFRIPGLRRKPHLESWTPGVFLKLPTMAQTFFLTSNI